MQLAIIPYQASEKASWNDFLIKLVQEEVSANDRSDIVLFLGPSTLGEKPGKEIFSEIREGGATFLYFRLSGVSGPDRIQRCVKQLHGKTFKFSSPVTLRKAISEMLRNRQKMVDRNTVRSEH